MKYSILFLLFTATVVIADNPDPDGGTLEAVDTSTKAGARKVGSGKTLKMVETGSPRQATITATPKKEPQENGFPQWEGDGLKNPTNGSSSADFEGMTDSTITAKFSPKGDASVDIDVVFASKSTFKIDKKSTGIEDFEEKITDWLARYGKKPTWQIGAEISGSSELCDFYNNGEKVGRKNSASGSVSVNAPQFEFEALPVPIGATGVNIILFAKFDPMTVSAKLSYEYNEELSDPWKDPVKGEISITGGGEAGVKARWGSDVFNVNVTGKAGVSVTSTGEFGKQNKDIQLTGAKLKMGEVKFTASANIEFWSGKIELWSGDYNPWPAAEFEVPGLPKTVYTIPGA